MTDYQIESSWQWERNTNTNQPLNDPLAVIYNEGQWRLNKVSPLYNLQYNALKLKQYAAKIRQSITSSITTGQCIKYIVSIEPQSTLKYSEDDPDGLMITVSACQEQADMTKTVYTCLLLSWGLCIKLNRATHLPYLLDRGEQKISTAVKTALQTVFDCSICQFSFSQQQLLHFMFNFIEYDTSKSDDPIVLTYRAPGNEKEKLQVALEIGDVHIIWNGIQKEATKKSESFSLAYQMIEQQIIHNMMSECVSHLNLVEVKLPKAEVKTNGSVKMRTPEIVNAVFTVLNEIPNAINTDIVMDVSS